MEDGPGIHGMFCLLSAPLPAHICDSGTYFLRWACPSRCLMWIDVSKLFSNLTTPQMHSERVVFPRINQQDRTSGYQTEQDIGSAYLLRCFSYETIVSQKERWLSIVPLPVPLLSETPMCNWSSRDVDRGNECFPTPHKPFTHNSTHTLSMPHITP